MKITLRFVSLNPRATWHRLVERQLNYLQSLTAMTAAQAVLVHLQDARPAFRLLVLLKVPGPDLHAEACDHTVEAALLKATQNLEHQIQARKTKRMERRKSHPPVPIGGPMLKRIKRLEAEENCFVASGARQFLSTDQRRNQLKTITAGGKAVDCKNQINL